MKMTEKQMRAWIKRLIEIVEQAKNAQISDEQRYRNVSQLIGYVESLENIEI
jgi:hypothetical protein